MFWCCLSAFRWTELNWASLRFLRQTAVPFLYFVCGLGLPSYRSKTRRLFGVTSGNGNSTASARTKTGSKSWSVWQAITCTTLLLHLTEARTHSEQKSFLWGFMCTMSYTMAGDRMTVFMPFLKHSVQQVLVAMANTARVVSYATVSQLNLVALSLGKGRVMVWVINCQIYMFLPLHNNWL